MSVGATERVYRSASPAGRRRLQAVARTRTDSTHLADVLADDEPPGGPPLDRELTARATASWAEADEGDRLGLDPGSTIADWLAAQRAEALDQIARLDRLPEMHQRALIRSAGLGGLPWTGALDGWQAAAEAQDRYVHWERGPSTPITAALAAGRALTAIEPPESEATLAGWRLVRGDEDELRAEAKRRARVAADEYQDTARTRALTGEVGEAPAWELAERIDWRWWLRRLRREAGAAAAYADTALRLARPGSDYVSACTLSAYHQRQARKSAWAAGTVVRFEDGTAVPLAEVQANGRRGRRAQLYAVSKAQEYWAETHDYVAFFITLTLPGHFHSVSSGARAEDGSYPHCRDNPDWEKIYGPKAAWKELSQTWQHFRAMLGKNAEHKKYFGISVPEPHKDGTPHLHALIYLPRTYTDKRGRLRSTAWRLRAILAHCAPGRQSRLEIVRKRRKKASASPASYVMKYIIKALDDEDSITAQGESGERYRAWASSRGIRRMRLVGCHGSLRVWQRLWTADEAEMEDAHPRAQRAWAALSRVRAAGEVAADPQLTDAERAAARRRQAAAAADALIEIGGLPGGDGRLRLLSRAAVSGYGRPTTRPIALHDPEVDDWSVEDWSPPAVGSARPAARIVFLTHLIVPLRRQRAELRPRPPHVSADERREAEARREAERNEERVRDYARLDAAVAAAWAGLAGAGPADEVTPGAICPRAGAQPRPPACGRPGPGPLPGVPGAARPPSRAQGPPPGPRPPRRSAAADLLADLAEAA